MVEGRAGADRLQPVPDEVHRPMLGAAVERLGRDPVEAAARVDAESVEMQADVEPAHQRNQAREQMRMVGEGGAGEMRIDLGYRLDIVGHR